MLVSKILKYSSSLNIENDLSKFLKTEMKQTFNINQIIRITILFAKKNNLLINSSYLNIVITLSLMEKIFRDCGVLNKGLASVDTQSIYNLDYMDCINFCNTKNIFLELKSYLENIVNKNMIHNNYNKYDEYTLTKSDQNNNKNQSISI